MSVRTQSAHTEPAETAEAPSDVSAHSPHTQPLTARQRMIVAQQVIDSMPWVKDMANSQFKSIPIDAMRAGVRKACIKAGLVHVGPLDLHYDVQSRDGRLKVYTGTATFRYINADDPHEYIDFPSLGEAMDTGDKGAGKLVSNLIKTHYKTAFDIGEQGRDDIDSYSNEDMIAEADRIAERRARRQEAVKDDPFFGKPKDDPLADLRRQIGPLMTDHADVVRRYKQENGPVPSWSEDVLRACIAEAKGGEQ